MTEQEQAPQQTDKKQKKKGSVFAPLKWGFQGFVVASVLAVGVYVGARVQDSSFSWQDAASQLAGQQSASQTQMSHVQESKDGVVLASRRSNAFGTMFGNNPNLVADVAEKLAPSVVNIDVTKHQQVSSRGLPPMFQDEMFQRFFGLGQGRRPGFRQPQQPRERTVRGNGSGVIIDAQGHIVTNYHVINGADEVTVTMNDGRHFSARVVGADRYSDLAVLKVDEPNLKFAPLGNSEQMRPGEWVLAVGSPLGFDHTVTLGIVSAISRHVPDINTNLDFIQTDAAINPGNSGGPLVNLKGEVIGINTAISGRGQNIGFAIPVNVVRDVVNNLITNGNVKRPWIGVAMSELSPELARSLGMEDGVQGVIVARVMPDSPSHKAGFRQGDVIQRMDGKRVTSPKTIQGIVQKKPVDSTLHFQILRDGEMMAIAVKTAQLPEGYLGSTQGQYNGQRPGARSGSRRRVQPRLRRQQR